MSGAALSPTQHRAASVRHRETSITFKAAEDEWAAVAMFYSAYHVVRAAMLDDPIWMNAGALARINVNLNHEDRFTSRHHGGVRPSGRVFGVNEIVGMLYPSIQGAYERLHQASIDVRYGVGLADGALEHLPSLLDQIHEAAERGDLAA